MPFDRIEGQPRVLALLSSALTAKRVAHAYAFVGPARSGRSTTALAFGEALLCADATSAGSCGRCPTCRRAAARQHPDLHVIVPTAPERNPKGPKAIRIVDIRELERRAALSPALASRKVFIVDNADRMTDDAPQAFLKTLEEPPDRTVIVLIVTTTRALPATVLSRCQIVRFAPRADAQAATARAEAQALFAEVRDKGAEALFRRVQSVDRERAEELVDAYWLLCRDLLLASVGAPERLLVNRGAATAREAEQWSIDDLLSQIETCRQAREALLTNVSPRLTLEVVLGPLALAAA